VGKHRAPSIPDPVLQIDKDFDTVAESSGQRVEPLNL
jgi:hypothetical protein